MLLLFLALISHSPASAFWHCVEGTMTEVSSNTRVEIRWGHVWIVDSGRKIAPSPEHEWCVNEAPKRLHKPNGEDPAQKFCFHHYSTPYSKETDSVHHPTVKQFFGPNRYDTEAKLFEPAEARFTNGDKLIFSDGALLYKKRVDPKVSGNYRSEFIGNISDSSFEIQGLGRYRYSVAAPTIEGGSASAKITVLDGDGKAVVQGLLRTSMKESPGCTSEIPAKRLKAAARQSVVFFAWKKLQIPGYFAPAWWK